MIDLYEAQQRLADFKNPFEKDCVVRISTWCFRNAFTNDWTYRGTVAFKNGNTGGDQEFQGISLVDVLQKMEVFVQSL